MSSNVSYGVCESCGHRTTKGHMLRHIQKCTGKGAIQKEHEPLLYLLRIEATYLPMYWLDIGIYADTTLMVLDKFLRDIWLECCGHMSQFEIGDYHYVMPHFGGYEIWEDEAGMDIAFSDAFGDKTDAFAYEYDFGTTTYLKGRVVGSLSGSIGKEPVQLLARNEPPDWKCSMCDEQATDICPYCIYQGGVFCEVHRDEHQCEDEYYLPVVNSPRAGECAYSGPGESFEDFWE